MKRFFLITSLLLIVCVIAGYLIVNKNNHSSVMSVNERNIFIKDANEHMTKMRAHEEKIKQTPEFKLKAQQLTEHLSDIHDAQSKYITFYGKVIDQHGQSVPNAQVVYEAAAPAAEATGRATTRTNDAGYFKIDDARGAVLGVDKIIAPGYDIKEFYQSFYAYKRNSSALMWTDHLTPETAYVFEAWKIEGGYPKVKRLQKQFGIKLTPDGRKTTFNLLAPVEQIWSKGVNSDGHFTLSFLNENENWSATLEFLRGGFIETNDLYMNLAPESGYQKSITYHFPINGSDQVKKYYYIKLDDTTYGKMDIDYRTSPSGNETRATIYLDYVVNLEQGRRLEVNQN